MKKTTSFILLILLSIKLFPQFPKFEWAHQTYVTCNNNVASIGNDSIGNIYSLFDINSSLPVDMDPGVGISYATNNLIMSNAIIQKLNSNEQLIWHKTIKDVYFPTASFDKAGNTFMVGSFTATTDFDPGVGIFQLTAKSSYDDFVVKLDGNGNFVWAKQFDFLDNSGAMRASKIFTDINGDIIVVGTFNQTVDFDPGSAVFNITAINNFVFVSSFILKLDSNGNFKWVKVIENTNSYGTVYGLCTDKIGNIYSCGYFLGILDLDPGLGVVNFDANIGGNMFLLKLDVNGNYLWAQNFDADCGWAHFNPIITDNNGDVYVAGKYNGTTDLDPSATNCLVTSKGLTDIFISKFSSSGNFLWGKTIGGLNEDDARYLQVDFAGNIYMTGKFYDLVDFDPGTSVYNLSNFNAAQWSIYCLKLNSSGNFLWATSIDMNINVMEDFVFCVDNLNNIYTAGVFGGYVDFDPSNLAIYNMDWANGYLFMQKLSQTNSPDGINENYNTDGVSVYPSPTNGNLFVDTKDDIADEISITNILGQILYSEKPQTSTIQINLSDKASGIYFVNVRNATSVKSIKILKQ